MNGEGSKEATATNLKRLRTEKNETQEDTAKAAGVSLSSYKAYENGERIPRDEVKVRLADHFGTTSQAIFFELNPVGEPTELKRKEVFIMNVEKIEGLTFELKETAALISHIAEGNECAEELYSIQKHLFRIVADLIGELDNAESA